jgi:PncC family amidohydrolase
VTRRKRWWAYFLPAQAKAARERDVPMRRVCGLEYRCESPPGEALLVVDCPLNEALRTRFVKKGWSLAAAESMTGGRLSDYVIQVPGASEYFAGSGVTYRLSTKTDVLGVPRRLLQEKGAVNEEVALKMAEGARRLFRTDWAVAVTGVAGPAVGSHNEPVGTIWTAVARKGACRAEATHLHGQAEHLGRDRVRWCAVHLALIHLWTATGGSR